MIHIENDINKLCKKQHEAAKSKGFYDKPREIGTLLMLTVSELSEALEADRLSKKAYLQEFEKAYHRNNSCESAKAHFEYFVKDSFEDEIADAILRLLDICGYLNIDIAKHIAYKMWYNSMRSQLHGKNY